MRPPYDRMARGGAPSLTTYTSTQENEAVPSDYLTPNMITALRVLHDTDRADKTLTVSEVGQHLTLRHVKSSSKRSTRGQARRSSRDRLTSGVLGALVRRGFAREALTERYGYSTRGWQVTAAGCAKLSEVSSTLPP